MKKDNSRQNKSEGLHTANAVDKGSERSADNICICGHEKIEHVIGHKHGKSYMKKDRCNGGGWVLCNCKGFHAKPICKNCKNRDLSDTKLKCPYCDNNSLGTKPQNTSVLNQSKNKLSENQYTDGINRFSEDKTQTFNLSDKGWNGKTGGFIGKVYLEKDIMNFIRLLKNSWEMDMSEKEFRHMIDRLIGDKLT